MSGPAPMSPSTAPDTSVNPGGVGNAPAGMVSGSGMTGPVPPGPLNTGTTPVYSMAGPGGPPVTFGPGVDPLQGSGVKVCHPCGVSLALVRHAFI